MSLIFEALEKLEREKQAPERGILVVGPSQWAGGSRVRLSLVAFGGLALIGLGVTIGTFMRQPPAAPAPAVAPVAAVPATAPLATLDTGPATAPQAGAAALGARRAPGPAPVAAPAARPAAAQLEAPPQGPVLTLQAVTEQDGVPVALINDRLLRVGDAFDGIKVLRIAPGEVEVEIGAIGERRVLTF